jgi:hypothetical protein
VGAAFVQSDLVALVLVTEIYMQWECQLTKIVVLHCSDMR